VSSDLAAIAGVEVLTRLAAVRLGPGLEDGVELGPLVNAATRDKVARLVTSAADDGGRVVLGGEAPGRPGYFYPATVKQSGIGREGGHDGLLEFTETKYVAVDW
jgi:acyl-CoA reductase-like NAD-dependent aldehyde dehydrogenase